MTYHIAIDGVQSGPHEESAVRSMIAAGRLRGSDLCWREGWPQWSPVAEAFPPNPGAAFAPQPPPSPASNPFTAAPAPGSANNDPALDAIRREHLDHEASIRSIGILHYLGGGLLALSTVVVLIAGAIGSAHGSAEIAGIAVGVGLLIGALAALHLWVGRGLRRLNPNVAIPATILSALGLFGFPVGTFVNGYILYLLHSQKGKFILGEGYQEIVAATPHIRYRTPVWLIVVAALIIVGVIAVAIALTLAAG
jgi:hypothetical protein